MASLKSEQLTHSPERITRDLRMPDGEHFAFRLLLPDDGERIGSYFESLSDETRSRFGPHPLDMATGHALCAELDYNNILRFIAVHKDAAIAYFILILIVRPGTRDRYSKYDIDLVDGEDCVFAPSVSDAHQNQGLGSILMPQIIDIAASLGYSRILLSGGTHSTNHRAIRYYQKFGFEEVGRFETKGDNIDMILQL
jgi:GNAT superfamily N-acetyltransferase